MRAVSSAVSLTVHVGLGAAVLLGTADAARSRPAPAVAVVYSPMVNETHKSAGGATGLPIPQIPDHTSIDVPLTTLPNGTSITSEFPVFSSSIATGGGGERDGWAAAIGQEGPEVLTGPVPMYPELLRQAGVEGRVLLETVVDTSGRVSPDSILVVFATNPGFVRVARQALIATLFRPAVVGGRPVRMRVRVPYEFAIRSGTRPAR